VDQLIYKTPDVMALAARLQPVLPLFWAGLLASGIISYAA
jgi:hypothetical protein